MSPRIRRVKGRRVWDSRGAPTVEAEVTLESGAVGRAIAPAGASMGRHEAVPRRDGGPAFGGRDVRGAVASVDGEIAAALRGEDPRDQAAIDDRLAALDGTPSLARLGANALVAVSTAVAQAAAAEERVPLWQVLADEPPTTLPLPEVQILGGRANTTRRMDLQDVMIIPIGAESYVQALDWAAEVTRAAGDILTEAGQLVGLADEGGFWPLVEGNAQAFELVVRAIERAGLEPGVEVALSVDVAAGQLSRGEGYDLPLDARRLDRGGMVELIGSWLDRYPIVSIEDPFAEDDLPAFAEITRRRGSRVQVVGDDLVGTTAGRVERAAHAGAGNAAMIKPSQAGTLTRARRALEAARRSGWGALVAGRSGDTEDVSVMHLAVGWGVPQVKIGGLTRGERTAKWNEGLRLADALGHDGPLPGIREFPWAASLAASGAR